MHDQNKLERMYSVRFTKLVKGLHRELRDTIRRFLYNNLNDTERTEDILSLLLSAHITSIDSSISFITSDSDYDEEDKEKVKSFLDGLKEHIANSGFIMHVTKLKQ